jgi:hypothetical protein
MKKLILCLTLIAFGFAVQATETKSPKDQAAPAKTTATMIAAKTDCCDAKKETAACTSCSGNSKQEMKKQTTMLLSPKAAAEKRT